jgi:hypothetical protein
MRENMLTEGIKCLYCQNKMKRTTRPDFQSKSGLDEYVCPNCWFVAYFVGDHDHANVNYYGVNMK